MDGALFIRIKHGDGTTFKVAILCNTKHTKQVERVHDNVTSWPKHLVQVTSRQRAQAHTSEEQRNNSKDSHIKGTEIGASNSLLSHTRSSFLLLLSKCLNQCFCCLSVGRL